MWEGDRVGSNRLPGRAAHHGYDAGRIQPGAEKCTDGDIAHHLAFYRLAKALTHFIRQIGFGSRVARIGSRKAQIPVLPNFQFAIAKRRTMSCRKLGDSAEHRLRVRNPEKGQILMQRLQIDLSLDAGGVKQGFYFRGERQLLTVLRIVERLHSEMITGQKQLRLARAQITDGKSKHALEAMHAIRAFFFVEVDHNFGICVGSKMVALVLQFTSEFSKVVDFTVVGDPDRAILIAHRHVAICRQIENGEAAAAETNIGSILESSLPQTGVVRTAMREDARHPSQYFPVSE